MFGKILGKAIEVATLPLDVMDVIVDVADGGNGSKSSRNRYGENPLTDIRDGIVKACEEIDD